MTKALWENIGRRVYWPGIDHGTLYIEPDQGVVMEDAWKANEEALREASVKGQHAMRLEVDEWAAERTGEILKAKAEPIEPSRYKEPFVYYEPAEGTGGLPAVICTCGQSKRHLRFKVLQRWAENHFMKTGHNTKPSKE